MRKTKLIAMLLCMTMILAMTASFTVSAASELIVSGIRVPVNNFQPITQDIHIDYLPNEIAIEEGTDLTIRTYVDVDLMLSSNIKYQWCMTKSNIHGTGVAIAGANAKDLTVPSDLAPGTYYFYLNMSCTFDGLNYSSDHSDASLAKVIVYSAEDAPEFDILPVGDTEVSVYDCETPVTLQVKTVNAGDEDVVILWHRSDEHGNILTAYNGGNPVSTTNTLTIDDMTYDEMMVPRYYRCMAQAGDTMKYTVYSVTLYPMGIEDEDEMELVPVGDLEVSVYDPEMSVTLQAEVINAGDRYADFQWFRCDEDGNILKEYNYGHPLSMGNTLTISDLSSDDMLAPRYYSCHAMIGGTMLNTLIYTVTLHEERAELVPVGDLEVNVYDPEATVILEAEVINAGDRYADFQWYRCDEDGNILKEYNYGHPLSMGSSLTISDLSSDDMLAPRYYSCHAMIGGTMLNTLIYSVTLNPMGVEDEYEFPFTDCSGHWGYSYIEASHKMGLLNGTSATTYAPNTDLTVAAAVKLAVCMNILYNGGDPNRDISVGRDVWYSTYMAYALEHGIIDTDLSSRQAEKITRSEYVYMFSRALPAEAFREINTVSVGSIPDVKTCNTKYEQAIYKFYRAGIVIGNNAGEFMPDNTISRAEVATILVRMMDTSFRSKK